jgi:hypothetical protein
MPMPKDWIARIAKADRQRTPKRGLLIPQQRTFGEVRGMSVQYHGTGSRSKKKPPHGGSQFQSQLLDQPDINAGFDFRR